MAAIKHSKQRDALIEILQSTDTHPTAEWVYDKMRDKFPNVSLATVYRNLKHMIELGMARELYTGKSSRFDANMEEHYHFICTSCDKLMDVFPKDENSEFKRLKNNGFEIERYDLSVYGLCTECKKAARR